MTLNIDDNFKVTSDSTSFSLLYKPTKKEDADKEPAFKAIGHYGTLQAALLGYMKNKMRADDIITDVQNVITYIETIEQNVLNALSTGNQS